MWITKKFARHQTRVRKKVLHEKKKKERNACFLVTKKKKSRQKTLR